MTTPAPEGGRRGRILIVDDEALLVKLFVRVLSQEHDLTGETDAAAALARFEAGERFDLIFCDLLMPKMSGIALHDAIARVDPQQARRMVFLTGDVGQPLAVEFFQRVDNLRLQKPLVPSALRDLARDRIKSQA
jgi:CheY-like chemotaxis protein